MLYILDSNVFIEAAKANYRMTEFPGYWEWMRLLAEGGVLASVVAVKDELRSPAVSSWADTLPNNVFRSPDATFENALSQVSKWVNDQPRFTTLAKRRFHNGADSSLIAEALARGGTVVTYETAAPDSQARVKIPDVCQAFGIECIFPHDMLSREGARFVLDDTVRQTLLGRIPLATR